MGAHFIRNIFYYENHYLDFFERLRPDVRKKFNWTLQLIATVDKVPEKYFKHMTDSTGIYEIKVEVGSDIYRVFSFFDKGNLIILLNGFQNSKNSTSMNNGTPNKKLTSFSSHLDEQYGPRGTAEREQYEEEFEAFKSGAMIQELRKKQGMTQEQLAEKCGTTKTYISRIENNASDIRLSTLMRIVRQGLGGNLHLNVTI